MAPASAAARRVDAIDPRELARNTDDPSKSSDTVLVGCKLPNGFIMEIVEPGQFTDNEGKPLHQSMQPNPSGQRIVINGANSLRQRTDRLAYGHYDFAITSVPRAFWDAWIARNSGLPFVKNGLVFVADSLADAKAEAKEKKDETTGLEALAHEKDPRVVKGSRVGLQTVEGDPESYQRAIAAPL